MKSTLVVVLALLGLAGCSSHQYETMASNGESDDGVTYNIEEGTLYVNYWEYQFVPKSQAVAKTCLKKAREVAQEVVGQPLTFQVIMERNPALGVTSCMAFAELPDET